MQIRRGYRGINDMIVAMPIVGCRYRATALYPVPVSSSLLGSLNDWEILSVYLSV